MITLNDLKGDVAALREKVQNSVNLNYAAIGQTNSQYREYLLADAGREHYKLIAAVTAMFPSQPVFDIGTHFGNSSLAMGLDAKAKIISYDVVDVKSLLMSPSNVTYKIGDFRADPELMESPFIFIDVDPHDGIQEKDFDQFFREVGYKGLTLWDDIHCNPEMESWWKGLDETGIEKYDLTVAGHWSGTGAIFYV